MIFFYKTSHKAVKTLSYHPKEVGGKVTDRDLGSLVMLSGFTGKPFHCVEF